MWWHNFGRGTCSSSFLHVNPYQLQFQGPSPVNSLLIFSTFLLSFLSSHWVKPSPWIFPPELEQKLLLEDHNRELRNCHKFMTPNLQWASPCHPDPSGPQLSTNCIKRFLEVSQISWCLSPSFPHNYIFSY